MSVYNLVWGDKSDDITVKDLSSYDNSLNGLKSAALDNQYDIGASNLCSLFLSQYRLDYIAHYCDSRKSPLRILSFPQPSSTCYEKAALLEGWNPLNIAKAFYLESSLDGSLYAVIVPETGCFLDKAYLRQALNLEEGEELVRAEALPSGMSYGTCSPFILPEDLVENGGNVKSIVFDQGTLSLKRREGLFDDFSFGMDHQFSLQINYYDCHAMLKERYPNAVVEADVLRLSFEERLIRKKGRLQIDYKFKSIDYKTAQFINSMHGYGDVSVENDHVDELFVPGIVNASVNRA